MRIVLTAGVIGLVATGCAVPSQGQTAAQISNMFLVSKSAVAQVAFDHKECPPERIRFIRSGDATIDWDVCGSVRRYKRFGGGDTRLTYLDVTSQYPADSLPAPLPPM